MKQREINIWSKLGEADAICITTNGFIKRNGCAVMGRGIAATAKKKFPGIDLLLGAMIKKRGNTVQILMRPHGGPTAIVSYPVKPASLEAPAPEEVVPHMRNRITNWQDVPGWAALADPDLIRTSANELAHLANQQGWNEVYLTQPGCHNGCLVWEHNIEEMLDEILDERFTICTPPNEEV